ncbi:MAG: hypothetical protein IJX38_05345 [Clostridia bacterium]|nr:hypothetical protein [Clostridia bacterium]
MIKRCVKKCLLSTVLAFLLLTSVTVVAHADGTGAREGFEEYIEEFQSLLPSGVSADAEASADMLGLDSILAEIVGTLDGSIGRIGGFLLLLVGSALLMALASNASGELSSACCTATVTVCSVAIFSGIMPVVSEVTRGIEGMSGFFSSLMPIMIGVNALGGAGATSAAHSVGMSLTLYLYSSLGNALSVLVMAIFVLGLIGTIDGGAAASIGRGVRSAFGKGMGILTALVSATLSLQTVITSSADSAAMRMAKYSASSMIPVVGSTVSGALSTLAGGLSYAKGAVGGGAVAALVMMALPPLVTLLLYKLCFFLAGVFLDFCSCTDGSRAIGSMAGGIDALISVYALTALIYIFEVVLFIMGGVNLS